MRSAFWRLPAPRTFHCLPLLCLLLLLALGLPGRAQLVDGTMLTNEIRGTRSRLEWERRNLSPRQLDALAYEVGRSNYLARAIENAMMQNDLPRAEQLLKEFPGTVDDIGFTFGREGLLYQAVQSAREGWVEFLLAHKANPNRLRPNGETPLLAALRYQRWSDGLRLLAAGANAALTNTQGESALEMVLRNWWGRPPGTDPREEVLAALLEHGADPFAPLRTGAYYSSEFPNQPIAGIELAFTRPSWQSDTATDLLLTNRPDPQRRTPSGQTALHLAALWGRTNIMQFLLERGFSPDLTNGVGLTPLQLLSVSPDLSPRPGRAGWQRRAMIMPMNGFSPSMPGMSPLPSDRNVAEFLLRHGATLDIFSAAGLGRTNELATLLAADKARLNARDGLGCTPLHYAVASLQEDSVRLLLRAGAALDLTNSKPLVPRAPQEPLPAGLTPLHLAVMRNSPALVQSLLRAGAPASPQDASGNTPLHLAARGGPTNLVALLLAAHATVDITNSSGQTPLHLAAATSSGNTVELLLQAHASTSYGLGSNTLLHVAASSGNLSSLPVLLRHRLPVDAPDGEGRTPLQLAVNRRSWDVLQLLRSKGANLNHQDARGDTALHFTAAMQDDDVNHLSDSPLWVKWKRDWMMGGGWRQQTLNKFIQWKLVAPPTAPTWTNTSLTSWLVEHGANPNLTNAAGQTPLYVMCAQPWQAYADQRTTNRVAALLQGGAKVELADAGGLSSLHVAATNTSAAVVTLLAQRVPHPEKLRDAQGRTPLHYAVRPIHNGYEDHATRLRALLAAGCPADLPDNPGRTPLHEAVALYSDWGWRQPDALLTLLTNRANPNLQDAHGFTPLHQAMQSWAKDPNYGVEDVCLLLLTNRAQPNLADRRGRTPLHLLASLSGPWAHPGGRLDGVLLKYPWDFAARDREGQTPIHLWCTNLDTGCWACKGLLATVLTNRALVNLTNNAGDTPLHVAIRSGREYTVQELLRAGANPAQRNARGETCYRLAVQKWDPGWHLEDGLRPPGTRNSFFHAIAQRDRQSFDLWLEADPGLCTVTNAQGQTPLQAATEHKLTDFAERLLGAGAPLDLLSALRLDYLNDFRKLLSKHQGSIPPGWLFDAVRFHRTEAAQALVDAGGDVRATDGEGHSLAYRAREAHLSGLEEWFRNKGCRDTLFDAVAADDRQLLEQFLAADPANINATNAQGCTPLLAALTARKEELVQFLLNHGANIQTCTPERWTALHLAAANNLLESGKLLLRAGADPNQLAAYGLGPLHLAAALGYAEFAELLLTNGADVNLCPPHEGGSFRNTPLHWAAHRGGLETVKVLLAHGADPTAPNGSGITPAGLSDPNRPGMYWFPTPPGLARPFPRNLSREERTEILHLLKEAEARATSNSASVRPHS